MQPTYRISYYSKVARQWFTHMHLWRESAVAAQVSEHLACGYAVHLWRESAVAAQVSEHLACGYAVRVVREGESPF